MLGQLSAMLDALADIKLLPRHDHEVDVLYGYAPADRLASVVEKLVATLSANGYEVHRCEWSGEAVLLALNAVPEPLAIRLTASASERYNLYALSRPSSAQTLWQWAQGQVRTNARKRREPWG